MVQQVARRIACGVARELARPARPGKERDLPDGPWGRAGWITALHQLGGTALVLAGAAGPRAHPTADLALDAIRYHHEAGTLR